LRVVEKNRYFGIYNTSRKHSLECSGGQPQNTSRQDATLGETKKNHFHNRPFRTIQYP